MYDHIKLLLDYPFKTDQERVQFCKSFNLLVRDDNKLIYYNKGYQALEQSKGIFMKLQCPKGKKQGSLTLSFSLHKFYNAVTKNKLQNYDDFNFSKANEAYKLFKGFLKIDLSKALVQKYELGINVVTQNNPDYYMLELNQISVQNRLMRILEDTHQKEYKQYSTNRDRNKRIVYIFYNKTFEARSKIKDVEKRSLTPNNILRVEMDKLACVQSICRLTASFQVCE